MGKREDPSRPLKTATPQNIQQPIDIATSNTQCASHLSALVFSSFSKRQTSVTVQITHFIHPWFENRDFGGRVTASTREMSRLSGGPMAPSYIDSRSSRKRNFEGVRRANRRLQSCSWRFARENYQIFQHFQPTKVMRKSSIMEPSLIEPISETNSPITGPIRIKPIMAKSFASHWWE